MGYFCNISVRLFSVMAICACGVIAPVSVHAQRETSARALSEIEHFVSVSTDNHNPVAAYSPNGNQLFIVWDGLINGNRRILLRERVAGEWLSPVVVDSNPAGTNELPTIAVDSNGTPHIAWVTTLQGKRRPAYARRLSRSDNSWFYQTAPFPKESTVAGNCDFLTLQLDEADQPWMTWQYGFGSICSISVSHFATNGELVSVELTPGATTLNLEPALFFAPEPTVYWYVAQSDQFYLVGSRYNTVAGEWQISPPEDLENLPADSLPDLFKTSNGPLAAIWYDRLESEGVGAPSDSIFLGIQGPETKGRGEAISGAQSDADFHSVAGLNSAGRFVTAWISESYLEGEQVMVGIGNSPVQMKTQVVSSDVNSSHENPAISIGKGEAVVVWETAPVTGSSAESVIALRTIDIP